MRRTTRAQRREGLRERAPRHYVMMSANGLLTTTEVTEEELVLHNAYVEAHQLLPPGYPSSDADIRAHLSQALGTLADPLSPSDAVLRAILILGHTPDERALTALRQHAADNGTHAAMAEIAADECAWWTESVPRAPVHAPRQSVMLN